MIILAYDIANDRVRTRFSNYLNKYGRRLQYSVYEIRNSQRVLQNVVSEIEYEYEKQFSGADSVVIFQVCEGDKRKIRRFGYAKNEEQDVVIFS